MRSYYYHIADEETEFEVVFFFCFYSPALGCTVVWFWEALWDEVGEPFDIFWPHYTNFFVVVLFP